MPILVVQDNKTNKLVAKVVPTKGTKEYARKAVRRFVEQVRYNMVLLKSDNEPAILALKEAATRETNAQIVMEEAPVGDRQASGVAEYAMQERTGSTQDAEGCLGEQDQKAS